MKRNSAAIASGISVLMILYGFVSTAQQNKELSLKDIKSIVQSENLKYFSALASYDSALFSSLYTSDCWIMAPNASVYCGPDAAKNYLLDAALSDKVKGGKFITIDVYGLDADTIAEVGFYQFLNALNVPFDHGKYIVLWKKSGDRLKRFRDCFSSSNAQ